MRARIFDVAHGFCAYVVADTTNVILVDCGHDVDSDFVPSEWLSNNGCTGIERFVVSNYDEDHLADLGNIRALGVTSLLRNTSATGTELRKIKEQSGPISDAMRQMLEMIDTYTGPVQPPIDFGAIETNVFYNRYPTYTDTNNLSLVLFLHYRDVHFAFTGDLEASGWTALLEDAAFRKELARTNFFVASHHGRESGYCKDVFTYCKPALVIISDAEHEDSAQVNLYAGHASGVNFNGTTRRVLNTWEVGSIAIEQPATGGWTVTIGV